MEKHQGTNKGRARRTGRREMLQMSAAGGLTLATGLFGALVAEAGAAAGDVGSITPQNGKLRRVVSALNAEGKSFIGTDDSVELANLFSTPAGKVMGEGAKGEPAHALSTATGQTRCFVASIPPHTDKKPTMQNRIGFHKGAGISYCLILNGGLTYMTDTQETVVRAGDLVVERSTLHSWRNDSSAPVSMFIVSVNAS
ncbi:MAG: cupin domain-containing protein [Acidimicrobiia bacterium]|nr:cupin domain-containing protein [Acidimicrobiia bacterium]